MPPISEARRRANEKYNAKAYDEIKIRVGKGRKAEIQAYAEAHQESVNGFVNRAISEAMARDAAASGAAGSAAEAKEGDA